MKQRDDYFDTSHLHAELKRHTARSSAITLLAQSTKFVLRLTGMVILARLLTPDEFGVVAMVMAVIGLLQIFRDAGLATATVQRATITHEQVSTLFWANVGISTVLTVLAVTVAIPLAMFYTEPRVAMICMALSIGFVLSGLGVQHQALLRRQMQFKRLVTVDLISITLATLAAVVGALVGMGYWALVLMELVLALSYTVGCWLTCRWRPGRPRRGHDSHSMLKFGGYLTLTSILTTFGTEAGVMLLGWAWGPAVLGIFSRAHSLLKMPQRQLNGPIAAVALPVLSRAQDDAALYRRAFVHALEKIMLLITPLMVWMMMSAHAMVDLVLGEQWHAAAPVLFLLGFSFLLQPLFNAMGWLFVSQGRMRAMVTFHGIGTVLRISAVVLGLPWGAQGVAIAISVRAALEVPLVLWIGTRHGPVRTMDIVRAMAFPLVLGAVGGLMIQALRPELNLTSSAGECAVVGGIVFVYWLVALSVLPTGRRILGDVRRLLCTLLPTPVGTPVMAK
jgi:O-antigen/teichoic acid export membrane protein